MQKTFADVADLLGVLAPGERVFLPGGAAEMPAVLAGICAGHAPPLKLIATYIAGLNAVPFDCLPQGTTFESIFAFPEGKGTQAAGTLRHIALPYGTYIGRLAGMAFDSAFVHVTLPDANGLCSYGPTVELTPLAVARAKRVFAVINPLMPRLPKSATFRLSDAAGVLELPAPLRTYDVGAPTAQMSTIAAHVANFISDGATLQIGIGKVPDALLKCLSGRRRLRMHSGMLSDGVRTLHEQGALDPAYAHVCCVHLGSADYLHWLDGNGFAHVRGCEFTHAAPVLHQLDKFIAVNGAVSVDLFGQANSELIDGRAISGVGGAPDFARAAASSPTGISIVALPAIAGKQNISRIVPKLDGLCALPRHDIDVVVTEFGAADLRGLTVMERAERLISIAAPEHHSGLTGAWREIAAKL